MPIRDERTGVARQFVGTVEGATELSRLLDDIATEYGPRNAATAFNQPLKRAWTHVRNDIERNTPVDTGGLKESVGLTVGRPTQKEYGSGRHVNRYTGAVARAGWFRGGRFGRTSSEQQALAVEFGTDAQSPQRPLRNAFARGRARALTILGTNIKDGLIRRSRALSRRRARGRLRFR